MLPSCLSLWYFVSFLSLTILFAHLIFLPTLSLHGLLYCFKHIYYSYALRCTHRVLSLHQTSINSLLSLKEELIGLSVFLGIFLLPLLMFYKLFFVLLHFNQVAKCSKTNYFSPLVIVIVISLTKGIISISTMLVFMYLCEHYHHILFHPDL